MSEAIWPPANDIRKYLSYIGPPVAVILVLVWGLLIARAGGPFGGLVDFFGSLFGAGTISGIVITYIVVVIVGCVLFYVPVIGPFWSIRENEIAVWPGHIMTLVTTILMSMGSWWGGVIMWVLWLMVWILGDYPIWEPATA
ncbi:MAG: hypothetical protein ACFFCM_20380 [Promethearchaeota archaeon]